MKRSLQHTRGIAKGDRSDTDLFWEEKYKQEKKERVYLEKPQKHSGQKKQRATIEANSTPAVYTVSRYIPERKLVVWASVIDNNLREVLKGVIQVKALKHRSLLSAVKTLGSLVGVDGMICYYDNPTWSEPLKQAAPPAGADEIEQQLWNVLFKLSAERNVKWEFIGNRKHWACAAAEKYLKLELARLRSTG